MTLVAIALMVLTFASCTRKSEIDLRALEGTWYTDLTGKTHFQWNDGPAINVWSFKADSTGVCDVFFTANDQPKAIEHQPFTFIINGNVMTFVMEDSTWDGVVSMADDKLTIDAGGRAVTFGRASAEQIASFEVWGKMDLMQVTPTPTE